MLSSSDEDEVIEERNEEKIRKTRRRLYDRYRTFFNHSQLERIIGEAGKERKDKSFRTLF